MDGYVVLHVRSRLGGRGGAEWNGILCVTLCDRITSFPGSESSSSINFATDFLPAPLRKGKTVNAYTPYGVHYTMICRKDCGS